MPQLTKIKTSKAKIKVDDSTKTATAATPFFKRSKFSHKQLIIFASVFALIGGYLLYRTFAATPLVATLEAEQMVLPAGGSVVNDATASSGKAISLSANGIATGSVNFPSSVSSLIITAKGTQCSGAPTMTVKLDALTLSSTSVSATSWSSYTVTPSAALTTGAHTLTITAANLGSVGHGNSKKISCTRTLSLDVTNFYGPAPPPTPTPTVSLSVIPTTVTTGQSSTLTWNSANATSCTASGAWSGSEPLSGSVSTGALNQNSSYTLSCTGAGGTANTSATVIVSGGSTSPSVYWGAYIEGVNTYAYYFPSQTPWSNAPLVDPGTTNAWDKFEADAGKKMSLVMFGQPNPWLGTFQPVYYNAAIARGAIPVVDMTTGSTLLTDITAGTYDAQITAWAQAAKAWGHPFFLRLDAEMNGHWYNYGQQAQTNPAAFVNMWRHMHDIFTGVGASNVSWHWCPNDDVLDPQSPLTPLEQLYPGDAYVDWTGMTGYNHGNETLSYVFDNTYTRVVNVAPSKPMQIGEIGSVDAGYPGQKAQFINDLFAAIPTKYSHIKAFVWFNWRINENGSTNPIWWDWPIESSSTGQSAFRQGISSSYYQNGSQENSFPLGTKVPIP